LDIAITIIVDNLSGCGVVFAYRDNCCREQPEDLPMKLNALLSALTIAATVGGSAPAFAADPIPADQEVRNVVLVHGAFADGSGWRPVYDELTARGYRVTVVQNPLTS